MKKYFIFVVWLALVAPFLLTLAGDAQVHLAVAENFVAGRPFQYNPNGELVVASTSPFWTMMLISFYWLVGAYTPLLLKLVTLLLWLAGAWLLYRLAQQWPLAPLARYGVVVLWLAHTTVMANALGGLENILSAFQLLLLVYLITQYGTKVTPRRSVWLGLLAGWMLLTRPDGGLLGLVVLGLFWSLVWWSQTRRVLASNIDNIHYTKPFGAILHSLPIFHLLLFALSAALVLLPWYLYQASVTGNFVTDSSLARLYTGRQGSLVLIPDRLYLHPKAFISLATAFLPLSVGVLAAMWGMVKNWKLETGDWRLEFESLQSLVSSLLLIVGFIFYTFIVGAESFGRYFLPLYPFLFLLGMYGLQQIYQFLCQRQTQVARLFVVLTVLFLLGTSGFDYVRRLGNGRSSLTYVLDVIYGPAHKQYFSFNLLPLLQAPHQRQQNTDELLAVLQAETAVPISIAVTEVQLRYFVDERVEVLSLDGRTSATILDYFEPSTGVPDFERYFEDAQPDYVHVNQWCEVGGFLAAYFPFAIRDNLVCLWQQQTEAMKLGDSFEWNGRNITLIAPEIVHIRWED